MADLDQRLERLEERFGAFEERLALIGNELALARVDRDYAAYLPAVGVVVLYLS